MSEEKILKVKESIKELKGKNVKLLSKIKKAKGPSAGNTQKVAQESIDKNLAKIKKLEDQLEALQSQDVTEEGVINLIEESNSPKQLLDIENRLPEDAPEEVLKAVEAKKKSFKKIKDNSGGKYMTLNQEQILKAQTVGIDGLFLAEYDPETKCGLLKPKSTGE